MPSTTTPAPRWIRRLAVALLTLAVVVPTTLTAPLAEPASATTNEEADFFARVNSERAARGLGALANDTAAAAVARRWSSTMANQNLLHHNPNVASEVSAEVTPHWQRIGENVGVGYAVTSLHDAFMNSPGHRANVLGDFNRVGVGVVNAGGGKIWVTFVFIKGPPIASAPFAAAWISPAGSLDSVSSGLGTLRVSGWAIDPDTTGPIEVHVYVGGVGTVLDANAWRGDIGAAYPKYGPSHGFSSEVKVPSAPGTYNVCAYGINAGHGSNSLLGCRRVRIDRNPTGSLDVVSGSVGSVRVGGWAIDPDTTGPIDVHVYVGGVGTVLHATQHRGDIARLFPKYGGSHGFSGDVRLPAANGVYDLCAYAINKGTGSNRGLGCRKVTVQHNPLGTLDSVRRVDGGVRVSGWSLDPNSADPIPVHVYVGSAGRGLDAARSRGDIARVFPGFGDRHGFDVVVPAGPGRTTVCAYGINVGPGGNKLLGCRVV